jgi:hypothetical protein
MRDNESQVDRRSTQDKIHFPFFLVKLSNESCYTIRQDDVTNRVCLFSDRPLDILHHEQIMKEILKKEYLKNKNSNEFKQKLNFCLKPDINAYIHKNGLLTKFLETEDIFSFYKKSFSFDGESKNFFIKRPAWV